MTRVLSVLTRTSDAPGASVPSSPSALRPSRAWWRDARVIAGVGLIVASMLIGARLLAGGSDTVQGWQAVRDLAQGAVVTSDDVAPVDIPASLADAYATEGLPTAALDRPLRAGEVLPAPVDAVATTARWVTVPVEPLHAPVDLAPGERVDVWATDTSDLGAVPAPRLVLEGVLVSNVAVDGVGLGGEYGVVLEVEPADTGDLLEAVRSGGIDLVRVPAVTP
jgi:hypothetical protein